MSKADTLVSQALMVRIIRSRKMTMADLDKETIARFLADLAQLTAKHRIRIGGCGCLGSPYLAPTKMPGCGHYETEGEDCLTYIEAKSEAIGL